MFYVLLILFALSILSVLHSYVFYPLYLFTSTNFSKEQNKIQYTENDLLPEVAILVAAYNEEKVIAQKIESTFSTNYPHNKITLYIGSDASSDNTNAIIQSFAQKNPQIKLIEFPGRTGKSGIINQLAQIANAEVFILTDANVVFQKETIFNLVKHFKNPEIKQVAANIVKFSPNNDGIAEQEKNYISIENKLKYFESIKWQAVMGAEGGCYAIRKEYYAPVPPKFSMDDFYITMNVLERKGKVLFEPNALCNEDVPSQAIEEFKRKVRISIGNFQNLHRYKKLLFPFWKGLGFAFLSHKVLRWCTPFFLIAAFILCALLTQYNILFSILVLGQLLLFLSPLFDQLFSKLGLRIVLLKYTGHFYLMNLALLNGFYKYISGIETNIWQPTKRNT